MKYFTIIIFLLFLSLSQQSGFQNPDDQKKDGQGIAFAFSGAGGRVAQHLALMEVLMKGLYPDGKPIRPDFVSGASSGAISAVAVSALLQSQDSGSNTFTWERIKDMLFSLQTDDVYDNSYVGLAKIMTYNIFEGYFLDNTPLKNYLANYLKEMNYTRFGDLYIPTQITIVNQSSGGDLRMWSTDPKYADLSLLDVIMASTSLPMAFPPRTVDGLGNTLFIDGGTGIDTIPVASLLLNPAVKQIYIICYGGALTSGGGTVPSYLNHLLLLKNGLAVIDDMRVDLFAGAIDMAADSRTTSFAYIPSLNQTFTALDFDVAKYQYQLTHAWAIKNNPQPLNSAFASEVKESISLNKKMRIH